MRDILRLVWSNLISPHDTLSSLAWIATRINGGTSTVIHHRALTIHTTTSSTIALVLVHFTNRLNRRRFTIITVPQARCEQHRPEVHATLRGNPACSFTAL